MARCVCEKVNCLHMCFMSGLSGGINTFCNKVRMTGMGSLCQIIGLSLSVWQSMVVFVSGGNPVQERERERQRKRERGGDGRLKNSFSFKCVRVTRCRSKFSPFHFYLVECLCTYEQCKQSAISSICFSDCPNSAEGFWSGQALGKEQGRAQGPTLSAGFQHTASFPDPDSVTRPSF